MEFAFLVGLGRPSNTGSSQSYSELLAVTLYPFFESKCNLHSPKSLFITQGCSIFLSSTLVIKNSQNAAPRRQNDKQPELYILIFYRHTLAGASWNNKHSFFFFFFPLDHHSSHLHKLKLQKVPEYSAHVFSVSY